MPTPNTNAQPAKSSLPFYASIGICFGIALWANLMPDAAIPALRGFSEWTLSWMGDAFVWSGSLFIVLLLGLAFSPIGRQRLGPEDSRPEFSTLSWWSMLFAAGMGTGLVVWGMAEPMTHAVQKPTNGSDPVADAFILTNFHWGFHAWAIYAVGALILAYFGFVRGKRYLPGSPIEAEFSGPWVAPVARSADVLAMVAVAFGVAGSMAMGTLMVHSGLTELFGFSADNAGVDWAILIGLFIAYMASSSTGLKKGIQWLSNANMLAAICLLGALFYWGGLGTMLSSAVSRSGEYLAAMPSLCTDINPFGVSREWFEGWTIPYMVWWVAWTPFVGIFIARISRGRTIREFVISVLVVPTVFSMIWFSTFGETIISASASDPEAYAALVNGDFSDLMTMMFKVFETLPAPQFLTALTTLLAAVFLVPSVDSATFVLGMLSSNGVQDPPASKKWAWGVLLLLLGAAFTMTNNMDAIKALIVAGSIPFFGVLLLQLAAFIKAIWRDVRSGRA